MPRPACRPPASSGGRGRRAGGALPVARRHGRGAHAPSARQEIEFIGKHGLGEYGRWHLGVDDEYAEDTTSHYDFPYGDFVKVHRCGVLAAEVGAAKRDYTDIEVAAAHLHGMLDALM